MQMAGAQSPFVSRRIDVRTNYACFLLEYHAAKAVESIDLHEMIV